MRIPTRAFIASSLLVIAALTGCHSDPLATDFDSVKAHPTPELLTLTERDVDAERNLAVVENNDWRMFWRDLGAAWYVDRPSYLSPYYIVPTGGQPR